MGFLSPFERLLLLRGLTRVAEVDSPSSFPFLRFLLMSLLRSLILLKVPLGLSGGKLAARVEFPATLRLVFDELSVLLVVWLIDGVAVFARLLLLPDFPVDNLSKTFDPGPVPGAGRGSRAEEDLESLSIKELFLAEAFLRSFSECPGRILPLVPGSPPSASSTLMIGTEVTYLPSTNSES